jgi:hypothetical protein
MLLKGLLGARRAAQAGLLPSVAVLSSIVVLVVLGMLAALAALVALAALAGCAALAALVALAALAGCAALAALELDRDAGRCFLGCGPRQAGGLQQREDLFVTQAHGFMGK